MAQKFSENVLDATNAYSHVVTLMNRAFGLPADVIAAAREAAEKVMEGGEPASRCRPTFR